MMAGGLKDRKPSPPTHSIQGILGSHNKHHPRFGYGLVLHKNLSFIRYCTLKILFDMQTSNFRNTDWGCFFVASTETSQVIAANMAPDCGCTVRKEAQSLSRSGTIQAGVRGEMVVAQVIVPACLVIDTETDEYPIIV